MAKWLEQNELYKMLSNNEKENFYSEVRDLKEDLEFFNMYMRRNKKSNFSFKVSFTRGLADSFLTYLYTKSYCYHNDDLEKLYSEYLVAKHFFMTLYEEEGEVVYTENDLKKIYNHFLFLHEIKLEDYVNSFIGCSRGCIGVMGKIQRLVKEDTNE